MYLRTTSQYSRPFSDLKCPAEADPRGHPQLLAQDALAQDCPGTGRPAGDSDRDRRGDMRRNAFDFEQALLQVWLVGPLVRLFVK
jgi:hypothetical protein